MYNASKPRVCPLSFVTFATFVSFFFAGALREASAQPVDTIGVRAQGMGGAFTAVADDATASWWNPAGMAGGAYFNALLEFGSHNEPPTDRTSAGDVRNARREEARSFAAAFPALAVSYYRLRTSEIQPQSSIAGTTGVRQEVGATDVRLRSVVLTQVGASIGQSLGSHLVIASTLKLVHAGAASQFQVARTASLDDAAALDVSGDTNPGLDVGAMASFGPARIGVMVRNVTEHDFGSGADAFTLRRLARVGAAVSSGRRGVIGSATLAVDADLTTTTTVEGDERRIAVGGELWTASRTFGFRGGGSVSTIDDRRGALSAGGSVALKKGLYADGEVTGATDLGRRGWSAGMRVTF
jgi:hypothetical protein